MAATMGIAVTTDIRGMLITRMAPATGILATRIIRMAPATSIHVTRTVTALAFHVLGKRDANSRQ